MLFSEVYGTYYNILAKLLEKAVAGELTRDEMYRIVEERALKRASSPSRRLWKIKPGP